MLKLSREDQEYFSGEDTWHGGPIFELTLVFSPEVWGEKIYEFIESELSLKPWQGLVQEHSLFSSIVRLDDHSIFGVEHYFYRRKKEPIYMHYDIGIRPTELIRLLGEYPGANSEWRRVDRKKFKLLLDLLIKISRQLHQKFPLEYATINDECYAAVNPRSGVISGIYIDEWFLPIVDKEGRIEKQLKFLAHLPWSKKND